MSSASYDSMISKYLAIPLLLSCTTTVGASDSRLAGLRAESASGQVKLLDGDESIATYVYEDNKISRPYFANLHGRNGIQVSRNHPPIEGTDLMDHSSLHPGLWMAFGDLSGTDNWRNKAPVVHQKFLQDPTTANGIVGFAVENAYKSTTEPAQTICVERCRYELHAVEGGYLLTWDSTFLGDMAFSFGDQEEMGLGFRVATPLRVEVREADLPLPTGSMIDSEGRRNARGIWGQSARWVDYNGLIDDAPAGMAVFCHPQNFRPTRFHARDYGFIAANPFSTAAFKVGRATRTTVRPGESLRLQYGVLLHAGEKLEATEIESLYEHYLKVSQPFAE